jgi:putative serine protease PepD
VSSSEPSRCSSSLRSAAVGAAAVALGDHGKATTAANATAASAPIQTVVNSSNASIATLVKAVDPVVVSLTVTGGNEEDEGSGIVLQSDGVILTNNHVISAAENGGTVEVTFTDGSSAPATIVAADASEDLAIVKATGVSGLATAVLADSGSVQVGDTVVAIGNELGLSNSVSSGIVSALHRKVSVASDENTPMTGGRNYGSQSSSGTTYSNAIQTDAAINQGDSGGALFNMQGQVIGIDSAIATGDSGSSGSVGVGFAIAINDAKAFITANS